MVDEDDTGGQGVGQGVGGSFRTGVLDVVMVMVIEVIMKLAP